MRTRRIIVPAVACVHLIFGSVTRLEIAGNGRRKSFWNVGWDRDGFHPANPCPRSHLICPSPTSVVKQANATSLPAIFSRIPCEYSGPAKACNLPPLTVIHAPLFSRTASDLHIRLAPSTWLKLQTRCSLGDWPVTQMSPLLPSTRRVNPPSTSTGTRPRLRLLNWHALDATIAAPALTIRQVRPVPPRSRPPF
jgi:hypothetical protein